MGNDVIFNKISTIERCVTRINDVYNNDFKNLSDYTKQDSIILNIQRACEACSNLAMHIVSEKNLESPKLVVMPLMYYVVIILSIPSLQKI